MAEIRAGSGRETQQKRNEADRDAGRCGRPGRETGRGRTAAGRNIRQTSAAKRALILKRRRARKIKKWIFRVAAMTAMLTMGITIGSMAKETVTDKQENNINVQIMETQLSLPQTVSVPGQDSPFLLLVNKDNPLSPDHEVELTWLNSGRAQVAKEIYDALSEMLTDGSEEGHTFCVASAYRSRERQQELVDEDVEALIRKGMNYDEAYEEVTRQTMPAGCSEHETGLAVDLVAADYQMLNDGQEKTAENIWLRENCHKYGFILRYPKGKEDITGVDYESWHFRYVGKEAAEYIMENGLTLEEYLKKTEGSQIVQKVWRAVW